MPVLRRLEALGLEVAPGKTKAILFRGRRRPTGLPALVRVKREYIRTSDTMKYLGVMLDHRLSFGAHFAYVGDKIASVSRGLCGVMPNLRGPDERKRRLYANVLESVALYGAPVWSEALQTSSKGRQIFRRSQRTITLRVCSAYRSVSFDAATLLARTTPYVLVADERRRIYWRIREAREAERDYDQKVITTEEKITTRQQWKRYRG